MRRATTKRDITLGAKYRNAPYENELIGRLEAAFFDAALEMCGDDPRLLKDVYNEARKARGYSEDWNKIHSVARENAIRRAPGALWGEHGKAFFVLVELK